MAMAISVKIQEQTKKILYDNIDKELNNHDIEYDVNSFKDKDSPAHAILSNMITSDDDDVFSSIGLMLESDPYIVFVAVKQEKIDYSSIGEKVIALYEQDKDKINDDQKVALFFIVQTYSKYLRITDDKKAVWKSIDSEKKIEEKKRGDIICIFNKDVSNDEIAINNIDRYSMQVMPNLTRKSLTSSQPVEMQGYVLSVKLEELVDLYMQLGNQLFSRNLRFGIRDELSVNEEIKKTLCNEPSKFWYRNNGVTLAIEGESDILQYSDKIVLKRKDSTKINFSVINGAQTLTAAAEVFYKAEDDSKLKEKLKEAFVLLRIICFQNDGNKDNAQNEARIVSIALNRQKPITVGDIAYSSNFVIGFNKIVEQYRSKGIKNEMLFDIVRRGESPTQQSMEVARFVRVLRACRHLPSDARNKGAKTLLQCTSSPEKGIIFNDELLEDWKSGSDHLEENNKRFERDFRAIYFADQLELSYQMYKKKALLSLNNKDFGSIDEQHKEMLLQEYTSIINNAGWFFVSVILYRLNKNKNKDDKDYTGFSYDCLKKIQEENVMIVLMEKFAEKSLELLNSDQQLPKPISVNTFKSNKAQELLKGTKYQLMDATLKKL